MIYLLRFVTSIKGKYVTVSYALKKKLSFIALKFYGYIKNHIPTFKLTQKSDFKKSYKAQGLGSSPSKNNSLKKNFLVTLLCLRHKLTY